MPLQTGLWHQFKVTWHGFSFPNWLPNSSKSSFFPTPVVPQLPQSYGDLRQMRFGCNAKHPYEPRRRGVRVGAFSDTLARSMIDRGCRPCWKRRSYAWKIIARDPARAVQNPGLWLFGKFWDRCVLPKGVTGLWFVLDYSGVLKPCRYVEFTKFYRGASSGCMEIGRFLEASHKPYRHSRNARSCRFEPFGASKAWFSLLEKGSRDRPRPENTHFQSQMETKLTPILEALKSAS